MFGTALAIVGAVVRFAPRTVTSPFAIAIFFRPESNCPPRG
jgi:hypothetical protein